MSSSDVLIGREPERTLLADVLADARRGTSRVLVLRGEPGTGKSTLLGRTAAAAQGFTVLRLAGAETEADLPFAAIQRALLPWAARVETLPAPQANALRVALGTSSGPAPDRFLVSLAVLSLLADLSADAPTLVLADDAQWLDRESLDALAFVGRRLRAERVAALLAVRTGTPGQAAVADLPTLELTGLARDEALALLRARVGTALDPHVADSIVTATGGNPLALLDLSGELSASQLAGGAVLAAPLPVGSHLEEHYQRLTQAYEPTTRRWLLLAAAEPDGDSTYVAAAASALGLPDDACAPPERDRLVTVDGPVVFRHPLVRSAVYRGATSGERRAAHAALAAVTDRAEDVDLRAWHLSSATTGPDEEAAAALVAGAGRAHARGGYAARAALLARAVELTPPGARRDERIVSAAEAASHAGSPVRALTLLEGVDGSTLAPTVLARSLMARAVARKYAGAARAAAESPGLFLRAARALRDTEPAAAQDALLAAFGEILAAESSAGDGVLEDLAREARVLAGPAGAGRTGAAPAHAPTALTPTLLTALAALATTPDARCVPALRAAVDAMRTPGATTSETFRRHGLLAVAVTTGLWDDAARDELLRQAAAQARAAGALPTLDSALWVLSLCETVMGRLGSAERLLAEVHELREAVGLSPEQARVFANVELLAWRGPDSRALRDRIDGAEQAAAHLGIGGAVSLARTARALLDLAAGDHAAAFDGLSVVAREGFMQVGTRVLPDLVEAARRSGHDDVALSALDRLAAVTLASGAPWGLGVLSRSRALVAPEGEADAHFRAAVGHLSRTRSVADLARTHLLHGEWLRRRRRRREAADALSTALDLFEGMGAAPFAARARRELSAVTGRAPTPRDRPTTGLTAQEQAVVEIAATGATNAEIAAHLFISTHTVHYHLRKAFRKLGVTSRRQLAHALRPPDGGGTPVPR
ncbi:AAA family ATPase [Oerskovia sp. Sa1BUA8]|uniref:AAA family ATPase n=1 Tax=Oerskovia douganii TaxID=2762210 RepID=A0A9D5UKT7_9CELL|nr:LuxR family transcriptional regulator [Oerskovia douganii]MBE7702342.1 AAA family ATPase [Oerskovia douganii]